MADPNDKVRMILNANLLRITQNIGMVAGVLATVLLPIWVFAINPPIEQLNGRVQKLETQYSELQKQLIGLDKSMAVMVEKMNSVDQGVKDIKDALKERR